LNLILFTPAELAAPLPRSDPRARHVLDTLRRHPGDSFDVGVINGPRGRARLEAVEPAALRLAFTWDPPAPVPPPLRLVVGLPRPQTARDILRDATTVGATGLEFVLTEKSDRAYAASTLWRDGEWERWLVAGAQQAFDTRVPTVRHGHPLAEACAQLPTGGTRLALDHYEAALPLDLAASRVMAPAVLAVGPERGWTAADRATLRAAGFTLAHLGPRVLRTETAVVVALAQLRARLDRA